MSLPRAVRSLFAFASPLLLAVSAVAGDWPTYRHDVRRSAVSDEALAAPLSEQWCFSPGHAPAPAWSDPQPKPIEGNLELPRLRFDDAFHVVVAGELAYFGSSVDTQVYALDVNTGAVRWRFFTDGPVRCAPTVWQGKLLFGSDDGNVYCLDAATGNRLWVFQAARRVERVLGNGRLSSVWPVRTGVLVEDGVATFGAGVFPGEGLYLYGVRVADGREVWRNDTYGSGGKGAISPQGYLLASTGKLFMPSGRAMPAAFDRASGRLLFQRNMNWRAIRPYGGTHCLLDGDLLYNGTEQIAGVRQTDGGLVFTDDVRRVLLTDTTVYLLTGRELVALPKSVWTKTCTKRLPFRQKINTTMPNFRRVKGYVDKAKRAGKEPAAQHLTELARWQKTLDQAQAEDEKLIADQDKHVLWRRECRATECMALARNLLFVGGVDAAWAFGTDTGKQAWTAAVKGKARGITLGAGRAFISTDQGFIHCFAPGTDGAATQVRAAAPDTARDPVNASLVRTAKQLLADSGISRGFGLILGTRIGPLVRELAQRSDLLLYGAESDESSIDSTRRLLASEGSYGTKAVVLHTAAARPALPQYFANLIVLQGDTDRARIATPPAELLRMLKPCGGVAYVLKGAPAAGRRYENWVDDLRGELEQLGEEQTRVTNTPDWIRIQRGPLAGAADWTHQYATPGNTACSGDKLVRGALGLLWYGDPGPGEMPSRHASAAAPLCMNGKLFVQGENVVMAYDAYNGLKLWKRTIPGALGTGLKTRSSNLCGDADSLYVIVKGKCLRLDNATGETTRTYTAPPAADGSPRAWGGYIARSDGRLFGISGSDTVFAVDVATGQTAWTAGSAGIMPVTICIDNGRLIFLDRGATERQRENCLAGVTAEQRVDRRGNPIAPDVRRIVALSANTGKVLWERAQYVSDCVKISKGGGELTTVLTDDVLLLCGQPWNGHFWEEFFAGDFSRRSLIAISAKDGSPLWSGRKGYRSRPLVVGSTIIAEPWAHDLRTGAAALRADPVTGLESKWQVSRPGHHCGNIAASENMLFFRSGTLAFYDMESDQGTMHWGGQRPGCWINFIPAGGVLTVPEASSGCVCPYSLHCTVTFYPRTQNRLWGMYSKEASLTPVKRLGINFGAPGDYRERGEALWLAYPRPGNTRLVLNFGLETQFFPHGGFVSGNPDAESMREVAKPWLYAHAARGLRRCVVPLVGVAEGAALYTVRLAFAAAPGDVRGKRVFSIKLQGAEHAADVDAAGLESQDVHTVVREFSGVEVRDQLVLELVPAAAAAAAEQWPLVCGIEIERERVLEVGLAMPDVMVNDMQPATQAHVKLGNFTEKPFVGTAVFRAAAQCAVRPASTPVKLDVGQRLTIPVSVAVNTKGERADLPWSARLVNGAGDVGTEAAATVQYLARQGRSTVTPSADAHVIASSVGRNLGANGSLAVDGGNKAMRDEHHAVALLAFPVDVPGRITTATLRLFVPPGGHTQSGNSGVVRLVSGDWSESKVTYETMPELGPEIGTIGRVDQNMWVERELDPAAIKGDVLNIALDPTGTDGATYVSREGKNKPELVIEYEAKSGEDQR